MGKVIYPVKPLEHLLHLEAPPFNAPALGAQWPSSNVRVSMARVERRWDTQTYRTLADGDVVQYCPIFKMSDGTYALLALTNTDLIIIRPDAGETYSYLTDSYKTGTISDISGYTVTGVGTAWLSSGLNPGDKFILDADLSAKVEPDTHWATIASIDTDTRIFLTDVYTGTLGTPTPATYRARKVYACPEGERWQYAVVAGKFCFTNSNCNAQYWDGIDPELTTPAGDHFAKDIDVVHARQAKYCIGYANRLLLADLYDSDIAAVNHWLLRTSAEGDPLNYTDSTAVDYKFEETQEPICGLGVSMGQLVVYKKTMYYIGSRTGTATDPLEFKGPYSGVGLYAPYSLVNIVGNNAWLGAEDFYIMNGDVATSIGSSIRHKFFSIVNEDQLSRVFGMNSIRHSEALWVADTSEGQKVIVFNYKENQWGMYDFSPALTGVGGLGF